MNRMRNLLFNLLYLRKPRWDTGVTPPELEEFVRNHPPGRALDLGCGTGTNAIFLAQRGWQVTAVDFVGRAVDAARRKARKAGVLVDFHREDVTRLAGIRSPFDLVLDIGCFHSLSSAEKAAYLHNLEKLLAPGGFFLLYAFITNSKNSKYGLSPGDLNRLETSLSLVERVDGMDREHPSAWFTFRREELPPVAPVLPGVIIRSDFKADM